MSSSASPPVDLTGSDVDYTLGLPGGEDLPPPGMTMDEVMQLLFERYGGDCELRERDRLRLAVDARVKVMISYDAPSSGVETAVLPAGTEFVVSMQPSPTAIGFPCRAADPDSVEEIAVPQRDRRDPKYGGFSFVFLKRDVGRHLVHVQEDPA